MNKLSIEELRSELRSIAQDKDYDPEVQHGKADALLVQFIADKSVSYWYRKIPKYYM